jgi:glutathione S-transferase
MRLWTKLVDEGLHVDSRTLGQCVAMRFVIREADPATIEKHYAAMPDEVRRDNDLINNEMGVDSPLLAGAVRRFKSKFYDIDRTLTDSPWLAGNSFSLADISLVVYSSRLESFQLAALLKGLPRLQEWQARIKARPSWAEAIEKWGDTSNPTRVARGKEAFPKIKTLWDAA